jgi:hypothetical protein
MSANDEQVSGDHYKKFGDLQPWDVILKFELGFLDGCATKYLLRWRHKNGIEDLKKAKHFIEKLIEVEQTRLHDNFLTQVNPYMPEVKSPR